MVRRYALNQGRACNRAMSVWHAFDERATSGNVYEPIWFVQRGVTELISQLVHS
jgi:hypothetical protein